MVTNYGVNNNINLKGLFNCQLWKEISFFFGGGGWGEEINYLILYHWKKYKSIKISSNKVTQSKWIRDNGNKDILKIMCQYHKEDENGRISLVQIILGKILF